MYIVDCDFFIANHSEGDGGFYFSKVLGTSILGSMVKSQCDLKPSYTVDHGMVGTAHFRFHSVDEAEAFAVFLNDKGYMSNLGEKATVRFE